jgi:predicted PurR-regulated permease PerM
MSLTAPQRQTLVWAAVAGLLLWILAAIGPVLAPFAAAAILAYVLEPAVRWLAGHRVPRTLAVILAMTLALAAACSVLLIVVPLVQSEVGQIRERIPALVGLFTEQWLPWLRERLGVDLRLDAASLRTRLAEQLSASGGDLASALLAYVRSGWAAAIQVLGLLFLVPVVAFYLLVDWPRIGPLLRELVPPRWQTGSFDLLGEIDTLLGQYLRGQLLVMAALAVWYSAGLLVAGFELWLPLGVLTGLLVAVPYLGFAVGLSFALLSGLLQFGPMQGLISVAVIYGVGQLLEGFVLTPRLVGERIGLHPAAVILALLAFGALFGFVGVLLALPLAAVAAVALRRLRTAYLGSDFYRGGP